MAEFVELQVRVNKTWQPKGTGAKVEMQQREAKWRELGYKTKLVPAK